MNTIIKTYQLNGPRGHIIASVIFLFCAAVMAFFYELVFDAHPGAFCRANIFSFVSCITFGLLGFIPLVRQKVSWPVFTSLAVSCILGPMTLLGTLFAVIELIY